MTVFLVWFLTKYSWKFRVCLFEIIFVFTGWFVMGVSVGLTLCILQSLRVVWLRVFPSLSIFVLAMWVARSRSPILNHVS